MSSKKDDKAEDVKGPDTVEQKGAETHFEPSDKPLDPEDTKPLIKEVEKESEAEREARKKKLNRRLNPSLPKPKREAF